MKTRIYSKDIDIEVKDKIRTECEKGYHFEDMFQNYIKNNMGRLWI